MAAEKHPDRDPFIGAIEAKIAAWTQVLESYKAAKALDGGAGVDVPAGAVGRGAPVDLPVGTFRDKGVKEAITVYLEAVRRKQTNKEIAEGLKRGGIATTSANFEATVATALLRLRKEGSVLRFPDGWDLASAYPDSLRNRLDADSTPKRGRKRRTPGRKRGPKPRPTKEIDSLASDMPVMPSGLRKIRIREDPEEAAS
jgi:hypothetical protein